jgi:hypothetical protein
MRHAIRAIKDSAYRKNADGRDAVAFAPFPRNATTADGASRAAAVPVKDRILACFDDERIGFYRRLPRADGTRRDYQKIGFATPA